MTFFSSFAAAFCAACIFIGALYILCPSGAMSKPTKYALELVFLLSVISAATFSAGGLDLSLFENTAPVSDSTELQIKTAEYVYSHALESAGIDFEKITLFTDKSEDGGIVITKITVFCTATSEEVATALYGIDESIVVEVVNE